MSSITAQSTILDHFNSSSFEARVKELMEAWHVPGISIAVLKGQTTSSKGYGLATLDPPRPCTAETVFDIASSSKSLTAAAVGLLVEDESYPNVVWDAKMSDILPEDFVMSNENYTKEVTVEDILSHRSGLPSHDDSFLHIRAAKPDTPQSVTRNLRNLPVSEPIRTKYQYCNIMYTVATHLISTLTSTSFHDYLSTHILNPLSMTRTTIQPSMARSLVGENHIALPYTWDEHLQTYRPVKIQECPEAIGAGSIMTSVNDYIHWVKALLYHESPITPSLYSNLTRARIIADPSSKDETREPFRSFTAYATGLEISYYRGHQMIGHDGSISGYGSRHFFLPDLEFGCVIFGNSNSANEVIEILAMELVDEFLRVPDSERVDWEGFQRDVQKKREKEDEESNAVNSLFPPLSQSGAEEQSLPLWRYCGSYWNAGYRGMEVEIRDGELYIDGSDRGFYLTFHHLRNQRVYAVDLKDYYDEIVDEKAFLAEFEFRKEGKEEVVRMGLMLESALEDYIWFDKVLDGNERRAAEVQVPMR